MPVGEGETMSGDIYVIGFQIDLFGNEIPIREEEIDYRVDEQKPLKNS